MGHIAPRRPFADCRQPGPVGKKPVVDDEMIHFNGVGEDGHETFVVMRARDSDFSFCKTAQKPYDAIVTAVLCLAYTIAPGVLKISSDGRSEEWATGLALAKAAWDDSVTNPISVGDEVDA